MRLLFLLAISVSLLWGKGIAEPQRSPMLWEHHENGVRISILGSIHFGRSALYPLHPAIESAYKDATALALEIDARKIPAGTDFLESHAFLDKGKSLQDVLSPNTFRKLKGYLRQTPIDYTAIRTMRPWYLSLNLADFTLNSLGLKANLGIDNFFTWRGIEDGKDIFELEGFEAQIRMMDTLPPMAEEALLKSSLYPLDEARSFMDRLLRAWEYSDLPLFNRLTQESLGDGEGSQELYTIMFLERNRTMADKIDRLIREGNQHLMVIIGAGHLIEKENVIELLNQKGYRFIKVP